MWSSGTSQPAAVTQSCRTARGSTSSYVTIRIARLRASHHGSARGGGFEPPSASALDPCVRGFKSDRKSTRLNSSHQINSYAAVCLKEKEDHVQGPTGWLGAQSGP